MEKQTFSVIIDASPERVWDILWGKDTYTAWTKAFSEGSRAITDWEKGSKVYFVDGNDEGMVSMVADKVPNQFMSFKHLGIKMKGQEEFDTPAARVWNGAMENYTLQPVNGKTELKIEVDVAEDYIDYFKNAWPKALQQLKQLAEQN